MARPFEGIRIIDITHVLAGPFAAYQLGLLGADVIKVEHPDDPDQSRDSGSDNELNHASMGTGFLTQGVEQARHHAEPEDRAGPRDPEEAGRAPPTCWWRTTGPARSRRWASAMRTCARSIRS